MAKLVVPGGEVSDFTYLKNPSRHEMPKIKGRADSALGVQNQAVFILESVLFLPKNVVF
jgi:hypothetical protein